ncbi:MAG TPA: hypothetical protein VHI52_00810 [Verrucomicrobiae bacterium]|nr:hypothetical protein [Verrucomicrobiae bacterium]
MRILLSMLLLGALVGAGCAHKPDGFSTRGFSSLPVSSPARPNLPAAPETVIVTPDPGLSGKIIKVNTGGRFVVLNFPVGHLPALDQQLSVYHAGLKVGEVKISGPQLDDNIIGDLMKGTAQAGDSVREE